MLKKKILILAIIKICVSTSGFSHSATTAGFLTILPGARPGALGGTFTSIADDVFGMFWNPSGLAKINYPEIGIMYENTYADVSRHFLGYAYPISKYSGTLGFSLSYIAYPTIEATDIYGIKKEVKDKDYAISLGYGIYFYNNLSFGVVLKYINTALAEKQTDGYAVDFGMSLTPFLKNFGLGVAVQNMGPKLGYNGTYYDLPTVTRIGINYRLQIYNVSIIPMVDVFKYIDEDLRFNAGLEITPKTKIFTPADRFFLRGGFSSSAKKVGPGISIGGGYRYNGYFDIDYAFIPLEEIYGVNHKISLSMKFGKEFKLAKAEREGALATFASIRNIIKPVPTEAYAAKPKETLVAWLRPEEIPRGMTLRGAKGPIIEDKTTLLVWNNYVGKKVNFGVEVKDDDGVKEVILEYRGTDGKTQQIQMDGPTGEKIGNWTCEIGPFEKEVELEFSLKAVDINNNKQTTKKREIQIKYQPGTTKPESVTKRITKNIIMLPVSIAEDCFYGLERVISFPFRVIFPKGK